MNLLLFSASCREHPSILLKFGLCFSLIGCECVVLLPFFLLLMQRFYSSVSLSNSQWLLSPSPCQSWGSQYSAGGSLAFLAPFTSTSWLPTGLSAFFFFLNLAVWACREMSGIISGFQSLLCPGWGARVWGGGAGAAVCPLCPCPEGRWVVAGDSLLCRAENVAHPRPQHRFPPLWNWTAACPPLRLEFRIIPSFREENAVH